ncbi:MAG: acetyl-CoA carboxylase biotin carboxyl carrier protein [Candidatus Marinimicrobia bacterium]|nr:acetyl-CoA carboxylase biotin carboxyl carrier protein [Candidatus Neomarinimicrobiota bacterium]
MNENLIRRLVQLVDESNINEIEFSKWGKKIRITKNAPVNAGEMVYHTPSSYMPQAPAPVNTIAAEAPVAEEAPAKSGHLVKSPIVGTYYAAPGPGEANFVKIGDNVSSGQTLCIIEAMKIMNEIEAETTGIISEILVNNGDAIEFDTPLFRIE